MRGYSGGPELEESALTQVDSSQKSQNLPPPNKKKIAKTIFEVKAPELFEESK